MDIRILMLGDSAFTVEFPQLKGAAGARKVRALRSAVEKQIANETFVGLIDIISATRSLTICIDPLIADFSLVRTQVHELTETIQDVEVAMALQWTLPACYAGDYAPDLEDIAEKAGLSPGEVIKLHSAEIYDITLIGFLPGFPFMSEISDVLRFPRRSSPRLRVPAGSVAIANDQTAIYPWESPGGWHLLARCPVPLFDPTWKRPSLLSPGDSVRFEPVSEQEFLALQADLKTRRLDPLSLSKEMKEAT